MGDCIGSTITVGTACCKGGVYGPDRGGTGGGVPSMRGLTTVVDIVTAR